MNFNKFFQSKTFKAILGGMIGIIIFLFIFGLGMVVGIKKAKFSYKWGENYHKNFAGPKGGFFNDFAGKDFIEANGVFGQIIKINDSEIIVEGRNKIEKVILAKDDTIIKSFQKTVKLADLKVDDFIVIIGEPNDAGQIEAKLIRIMPSPPTGALPMPLSFSAH